jgi:hypothetical protein
MVTDEHRVRLDKWLCGFSMADRVMKYIHKNNA